MLNEKHAGWKHPGRRSSDYSLSDNHDHDRRIFASAEDFSHRGPKGYSRDGKIHDEVCESLKIDPDVDATNIEVLVRDNCVHLEGQVDSRHAKKMAEQISESIYGVVDVFNHLEIKPTLDVNSDKIIARGDDGLYSTEAIREY